MACTKESVYAWFNEYELFLKEHGVTSEDQIYNCDESGFPIQTGTSMKVCCDRQVRRNFQIASNSKTSITTLQCICANGSVIPPAIIYPGLNFNPEYCIGFPSNFHLGFTKNGWMETSQFYGWLTNHFVKRIPPIRPIVLLIDGHASHIDYHTSLFCSENGILLFRFPPHTSYALQPTDRGYFGVFKSNFSKEVAKFTVQYPSVSITKRTFPRIFKNAYEISCSVETIKSSFRATGTWPVNRFKVDHDLFNPSEIYTDATSHNSDVEMKVNSTVASVGCSVDDGTHILTSVQSSDRTAALVDVSRLQGSDLPTTSIPGGSRSVLAASPISGRNNVRSSVMTGQIRIMTGQKTLRFRPCPVISY